MITQFNKRTLYKQALYAILGLKNGFLQKIPPSTKRQGVIGMARFNGYYNKHHRQHHDGSSH